MSLTAGELARRLDGTIIGDPLRTIRDGQSIDKAGADDLAFVTDEVSVRKIGTTRAGVVLLDPSLANRAGERPDPPVMILVKDPLGGFIRALEALRPRRPRSVIGISHAAHIAASATIGPETNVFPGAWIGEDVVIGAHCDVHPGAYIGDGCRLGDDVTLHPQAVLYPGVVLGDRVIVHASAVLGADGFGYRLVDGRHERIPHLGTVRIGDDVEIGASTTIDRAMIGQTTIGEGTKLDNLVMVGHNCEVGRHNIMVAQVALAGSVTTGDYVVCAGQAGIADHVHLGTGCTIGAKSGVHKDVPAGETQIGSPAIAVDEAMRSVLIQKKVPEMRTQLKKLVAQVALLERRIDELTADPSEREAA